EPIWMAQLKENPGFFGNARKTVYALKSVSDPEAMTHLAELYNKGEVPEDYRQDVLTSIAKWGGANEINGLFNLAVEDLPIHNKSRADHFRALEAAVRQRDLKPTEGL